MMEKMVTIRNLCGEMVTVSESRAKMMQVLSVDPASLELLDMEKEMEACALKPGELDKLLDLYYFSTCGLRRDVKRSAFRTFLR